jgi:hypothetical protein
MSDNTIEIDRLALADAVANLRIARKQFNNGQTRLVQGITEIEAFLANEDPDEDPAFTIGCISCSYEFDPLQTSHIIIGPWSARYTCPECGTTMRGPSPNSERSEIPTRNSTTTLRSVSGISQKESGDRSMSCSSRTKDRVSLSRAPRKRSSLRSVPKRDRDREYPQSRWSLSRR